MDEKNNTKNESPKGSKRMPEDSVFFDKLVPLLLIVIGVLMVLLILVAAGVLLGFF